MNRSSRSAVLIGLVVAAALGFVLARPASQPSEPPATSTAPTARAPSTSTTVTAAPVPAPGAVIRLRDGKPVGGVRRIAVRRGEPVHIRVSSDVADELHLHGYDITRGVTAGGVATFAFRATLEGAFELESHQAHDLIARVTVRP